MATHRIEMTGKTRNQIAANNGNVSTARKGKDGHSKKNRTLLGDQKYPIIAQYGYWTPTRY